MKPATAAWMLAGLVFVCSVTYGEVPCEVWDHEFDFSVSDVTILGDVAVVGIASAEDLGHRAGRAYVLARRGNAWFVDAELQGSETVEEHRFGSSVDLWRTGDDLLLAVGSRGHGNHRGAIYVFRWDRDSGWIEEALLKPLAGSSYELGLRVAGAGRFVVAGSKRNTANIYWREAPGSWEKVREIEVTSDPVVDIAVAASSSAVGDFVMVGGENRGNGVVRILGRSAEYWQEEAVFERGRSGHFGDSLALGLDEGDLFAVIGDNNVEGGGAVGILRRGADAIWTLEQTLRSKAEGTRGFGSCVALDGGHLAVGLGGGAGLDLYRRVEGDWALRERVPLASARNVALHRRSLIAGGIFVAKVLSFDRATACGCAEGSIDVRGGGPVSVLSINGSAGGRDRSVQVREGERIIGILLQPPSGGRGNFVLHANAARPSTEMAAVLRHDLGISCFRFLMSRGAAPVAAWNNVGAESRVGGSHYFDGTPIPDPAPAPTVFLQLDSGDPAFLPAGSVITFQALLHDRNAGGAFPLSPTNAVTLEVH